jgi:hypothetical protein
VWWLRGVSPPYSAGRREGARSPSFSCSLGRLPNTQNRLNKENGGREQGKGFQIRRTAGREGNNFICFVKIKRMEVENKAKAPEYATACRKGNNLICLDKTKRMEVEN